MCPAPTNVLYTPSLFCKWVNKADVNPLVIVTDWQQEWLLYCSAFYTSYTSLYRMILKISIFPPFISNCFLHFNCNVFENSSSFNKCVCQAQLIIWIIQHYSRSFNDIFWKWPILFSEYVFMSVNEKIFSIFCIMIASACLQFTLTLGLCLTPASRIIRHYRTY